MGSLHHLQHQNKSFLSPYPLPPTDFYSLHAFARINSIIKQSHQNVHQSPIKWEHACTCTQTWLLLHANMTTCIPVGHSQGKWPTDTYVDSCKKKLLELTVNAWNNLGNNLAVSFSLYNTRQQFLCHHSGQLPST